MKKIDLLKRDLADVNMYGDFKRCPVCRHLYRTGWCCSECGWNGEKRDIKGYKKEYKQR